MTYQPIENYGMIGDMHTVALVGSKNCVWSAAEFVAVVAAALRASTRTEPTMGKIVSGYRINRKQIFPEQRPLRY